jgi:transposase
MSTLSPDMSPIKQLFDELSRRVRRHQNAPEALQELRDALVHE